MHLEINVNQSINQRNFNRPSIHLKRSDTEPFVWWRMVQTYLIFILEVKVQTQCQYLICAKTYCANNDYAMTLLVSNDDNNHKIIKWNSTFSWLLNFLRHRFVVDKKELFPEIHFRFLDSLWPKLIHKISNAKDPDPHKTKYQQKNKTFCSQPPNLNC